MRLVYQELSAIALILSACNTAPGEFTVVIAPENPTTVDDLVARVTDPTSDSSSEALTYAYAWFRNDEAVADVTGDTVSADLTERGEAWKVLVTASEGGTEGPPASAETMIVNALPGAEVAIAPESPRTGEALVATATSSDDDGDAVTLDWSWLVDGTSTTFHDDTVPAGQTVRGQVWTASVLPKDVYDFGEAATASVTVDNVAPVISSVTLAPDPAYEESLVEAVIDATDLDGDPVTFSYAWYVNDGLVLEGEVGTLDSSHFDEGDSVKVVVTPNDGFTGGEPVESEPIVIANTPPGAPVVTILPEEVEDADNLLCVISTDSTDADGDAVSTTFSWTRNGVAFAGATQTTWPGDTILARDTSPRDLWVCIVTPNDGTSDGTPGTDTARVRCGDDLDSDGYIAEECGGDDCNDGSRTIHPGATETVGDGVDQDCSGTETCYVDADDDGYGTSSTVVSADVDCSDTGEASVSGDCNDASASVSPGATEVCGDGVDDNCDGEDASCRYTGDFDLGSTGFKLVGEDAGDDAGLSVAGACDVNADGYDDVLVGAVCDEDGGSDAGAAYLIYGPVTGGFDLSAADAKLIGDEAGETAGRSVALVGDTDIDGYADLFIGAPSDSEGGSNAGAAYLVYGPVPGDMSLSAADAKLIGERAGDNTGTTVAAAGDVDADGYGDLLVGSECNDAGGADAGAAYLVYGTITGDIRLSSADAKFTGEDAGDYAGYSVASAGDADADGYSDLLVGAIYDDDGGSDAGAAYLISGPVVGDLDLSSADAKLIGENSQDHAGTSVAGVGDADMDGYDDLLVGAMDNDEGGSSAGAAYLVYGPIVGDLGLSAADAKLIGEDVDNRTGRSVASAGDVDGDGHVDLLVGAECDDDGGRDAGAAYLVYGPVSGDLDLSAADARFIGEDEGDNTGVSVASAGDVDADGHADLLIGAYGDEDGGGAFAGAAYLVLFADLP